MKRSNPILDNPKNGGIHSKRQLKSIETLLTTHDLKNAVIYQFILSGATKAEYQATIKALMRHIRTKCKAEYIGAYEVGDEKGGLHCHVYVVIETAHQIPRYLLDVSPGQFIARRVARKAKAKKNPTDKSLSIRIEPPKAPMHGGAMFARTDTPAKLADCIDWIEYHIKGRSKDDVPGRETYFASEFASNTGKREAVRQKYRDALTKSSKTAVKAASFPPESGKVISAKAVKNSAVLAAFNPIQEKTPFPLVGSRLEGQITLTEKETQHEGIATASNGPGQDDTSRGTESPASSPYSSPSGIYGQPGMGQAGQGPRVPAPSPSASTEAEAIRPERTHGGAAGPAGEANLPITHSPGEAIMLTTAQKYIASRYEEAVDLQLDVGAVRRYLLARGIRHTPAQVVHQLDNVLCFTGYAASHPAPLVNVEAYDRTTARKDWINPITSTYGPKEPRLTRVCLSDPIKLSHKVGSIGLTVSEPASIIEPSTLLNQARSQA